MAIKIEFVTLPDIDILILRRAVKILGHSKRSRRRNRAKIKSFERAEIKIVSHAFDLEFPE